MGQSANNLVVIKGAKEDLSAFKKTAYKNDSEAFCFQQLLPYPSYYEENEEGVNKQQDIYGDLFYGNRWGAGYGVLMREQDELLIYMFNSEDTIANLDYVAQEYANLEFVHIGIKPRIIVNEGDDYLLSRYVKYQGGERVISLEVPKADYEWVIFYSTDTDTATDSYEYIAELYVKFESLIKKSADCSDWGMFYTMFHRPTFQRENHEYFVDILHDVVRIKYKDIKWVKGEKYNPLLTYNVSKTIKFINNNFNYDVQSQYHEYVVNNIDFDNIEDDDLIMVADYISDHPDNYDLFIRLVRIVLTRAIDTLDNIISTHQEKKKLLKDFPGVIPFYSVVGSSMLEVCFCWADLNILQDKNSEYNDKKERMERFSFDYILELEANAKIEDIDNYEDRKVKAIELIKEIANYPSLYTQSYQKLKKRVSDKENPLKLGFEVRASPPEVDDSYLQKIASKYGVLDDLTKLKGKDGEG